MSLSEPAGGLFAKPYEEIGALQARRRMGNGAIPVDVREPAECAAGHSECARHIPLAQLGQRQHELPVGRPVIAVCRLRARSARAATLLAELAGDAPNLDGGMPAWAAAGLPVVTKSGRPGAVICVSLLWSKSAGLRPGAATTRASCLTETK